MFSNQNFANLSANGISVPFLGTDVSAVVDDALTNVRIAQRYRNGESDPIESVYTFPLPAGATLLDFTVTLGDRRLIGNIIELSKAAQRYEEAVEKGDSAVLLEDLGNGLFAANIGNLLPGEKAEIVFCYAIENRWEDGKLRWRLPTVVAPRYGASGFAAQHEPVTDIAAEYRTSFEIRLSGAISSATVQSPSHPLIVSHEDEQTVVRAKQGDIAMDRDILVDFVLAEVASSAQMAPDGDEVVVWASLMPKTEAWSDEGGRNLTIVLDCSGSMGGDSITIARLAVGHILAELSERDRFNLVLFGSTVRPLFTVPVPATRENLRQAEAIVRSIDANMGGTEIGAALEMAYASNLEAGCIILVTDGQAYDQGTLIEAARRSRQRIFSVGVGHQAEEVLVRGLAEATGGAAELVSPGDAMAEAIARQFRRIKAGAVGAVRLTWTDEPVETAPLPKAIFAGDALHLTARFATRPSGKVTLQATRADGKPIEATIDLATATWREDDMLGRMTAARKIASLVQSWRGAPDNHASERTEGLALALRYRLLCPWTGMVVVRENEVKASGDPIMRKIPQMAPFGMTMVAAPAPQVRSYYASPQSVDAMSAPMSAAPMPASSMSAAPRAAAPRQLPDLSIPNLLRKPSERASSELQFEGNRRSGRRRFIWRLRIHVRLYGVPNTIDRLVVLRLDEATENHLRQLAIQYGEAIVVDTFVSALLQRQSASASPAPHELVHAIRLVLLRA